MPLPARRTTRLAAANASSARSEMVGPNIVVQGMGRSWGLSAREGFAQVDVLIGPGDGVVFDWEPTLTSAAELLTAPRGTDPRLDALNRPTTVQRRQGYKERMDAKAEARAELERERDAGV